LPARKKYSFGQVITIRPVHSTDVSESFLSSQSHKALESESSKIFSSQSHDLVVSSQNRVTTTVESLRVIGVQARVNVESHEISRFFYDTFLL